MLSTLQSTHSTVTVPGPPPTAKGPAEVARRPPRFPCPVVDVDVDGSIDDV